MNPHGNKGQYVRTVYKTHKSKETPFGKPILK